MWNILCSTQLHITDSQFCEWHPPYHIVSVFIDDLVQTRRILYVPCCDSTLRTRPVQTTCGSSYEAWGMAWSTYEAFHDYNVFCVGRFGHTSSDTWEMIVIDYATGKDVKQQFFLSTLTVISRHNNDIWHRLKADR